MALINSKNIELSTNRVPANYFWFPYFHSASVPFGYITKINPESYTYERLYKKEFQPKGTFQILGNFNFRYDYGVYIPSVNKYSFCSPTSPMLASGYKIQEENGNIIDLKKEIQTLKKELQILKEHINDIEMRPPNVGGRFYEESKLSFENKL